MDGKPVGNAGRDGGTREKVSCEYGLRSSRGSIIQVRYGIRENGASAWRGRTTLHQLWTVVAMEGTSRRYSKQLSSSTSRCTCTDIMSLCTRAMQAAAMIEANCFGGSDALWTVIREDAVMIEANCIFEVLDSGACGYARTSPTACLGSDQIPVGLPATMPSLRSAFRWGGKLCAASKGEGPLVFIAINRMFFFLDCARAAAGLSSVEIWKSTIGGRLTRGHLLQRIEI
ncbi:hypothetical protein DFH06DRAFT_1131000 [Mycena polygramma]|nr:hypothetical protein DFH06DRAFT_1131000 [Mycena polygramma]